MTITTELYQEIQRCNPYRLLRAELNKTQQEIAVLAGVTNKYIYRVENGLINSPTPSVTMAYVHELHTDRILGALRTVLALGGPVNFMLPLPDQTTDIMLARCINDAYIHWRTFSRWFIKGVLTLAGSDFVATNLINGKYSKIIATDRNHPIYNFQYNFCRIISPRVGIAVDPSQQLFSKLCTMHPRNWQLYAESGNYTMPYELRSVLLECGVASEILNDLEDIVHDWLRGPYLP